MKRSTEQNLLQSRTKRAGIAFAWIGVTLYASSNSLATFLVGIGEVNPMADGRNAITFSNLLLLGSLISLLPMLLMFHRDWTRENLRLLGRADWGLLTLSALLSSAVTPGLFFFALEHSTVTNVVLVSRIEPLVFLAAAWLFLKERMDGTALEAGGIALCGAMLMITMRSGDGQCVFDIGEIAAVTATLSYVASTLVARKTLKRVPMGIFSVYRTCVGTLFYFFLVSALRGPQQFQDIFAPIMLQWIWLYAIVVIIFGQIVWFFALKYARSQDLSLATSVSPLIGILFAMVLLGEKTGPGFLPGAALILLAVLVARSEEPLTRKIVRSWRNSSIDKIMDVRRVRSSMAMTNEAKPACCNGA